MAGKKLNQIAQALVEAPRQGAEADVPEGSRYVVISDTAVAEIIRELRAIREAIDHPRQTAERENAEFLAGLKSE
jgi:hypothetical protein